MRGRAPGGGPWTKLFDHFLLTRFNLRIAYADAGAGLDPDWLMHRSELFDRFCYPSVRGQTNQDFRWIVFLDTRTPAPFRRRIEAYARWRNLVPVYLDGYSEEAVGEAVASLCSPAREYVVTTRLDNDDALHRDFVDVVQENFAPQHLRVLNFPRGYVWHRGRIYLNHLASGPFASLVEAVGECRGRCRTVFWKPHAELQAMPGFFSLSERPMWLQVVHERNVSNRPAGIRHPIRGLDGFAIDAADLALQENPLLLRLDQLFSRLSSGAKGTLRRLRTHGLSRQ